MLMLVGAMMGLLAQEAAFARAMPSTMTEQFSTSLQMSADCAEMMGSAQQNPQPDEPCEGMTPDCIAKMGCAVPVALIPPLLSTHPAEMCLTTPLQMPVAPLVGRETSPEPHPPSRLG